MSVFIHQTAVIDDGAQIGDDTQIWHFSHVSDTANIGKNVTIGQNVFIGKNVKIDDYCKIQNNVSIFEGVELENSVFCGPSVVFTNVINPRANINRRSEFKKTLIKRGVTLGANSTIVCGTTLGEFAFVGAGAVITKNVKAFALVVGNPARQIGWVSKNGERISLPLQGKGVFKCKKTGEIYELKDNKLNLIQ